MKLSLAFFAVALLAMSVACEELRETTPTPTATPSLGPEVPTTGETVIPTGTPSTAPDRGAAVVTTTTLRVEPTGEFSWSCSQDASGGLSCGGRVDPNAPLLGRWSCTEAGSGWWECSGNLDRTDAIAERWACGSAVAEAWECRGDVSKDDATMGRWSCRLDPDGRWACEGDIGGEASMLTRWNCGMEGLVWVCSKEIGTLYSLMAPVIATSHGK